MSRKLNCWTPTYRLQTAYMGSSLPTPALQRSSRFSIPGFRSNESTERAWILIVPTCHLLTSMREVLSKLSPSLVIQAMLPTTLDQQASSWQLLSAASAGILLICGIFLIVLAKPQASRDKFSAFTGFCRFLYASFLKSHSGDGTGAGQQGALESFYNLQVRHQWVSSTELIVRICRLMYTIRHEKFCSKAVRICLGWWQPN